MALCVQALLGVLVALAAPGPLVYPSLATQEGREDPEAPVNLLALLHHQGLAPLLVLGFLFLLVFLTLLAFQVCLFQGIPVDLGVLAFLEDLLFQCQGHPVGLQVQGGPGAQPLLGHPSHLLQLFHLSKK